MAQSMKNKLIVLLFFCAAAMLVWVSSGFSFGVYSPGCGACHPTGYPSALHTTHAWVPACTTCHVSGSGTLPVPTNTCAGCHLVGDPGFCPLVIGHDDQVVRCLDCHSACDTVECETDADCDDADLCTSDACVKGACVNTEIDCGVEVCNPADGACVECLIGADCEKGESCIDQMCTVLECRDGTPDEVFLYDQTGDCLLNKDELKNYKQTLEADQKAEKTGLKEDQKAEKDEYKMIEKEYSTK